MATRVPVAAGNAAVRTAAIVAAVAALVAALLVLWLVRDMVAAAGFLGGGVIAIGMVVVWRLLAPVAAVSGSASVDWAFVRSVAAASADAVAITDRAGRLVCANDAYSTLFDGFPTPPGLPIAEAAVTELGRVGRVAWRDGHAHLADLRVEGGMLSVTIERTGEEADMLVWRFAVADRQDAADTIDAAIGDGGGDRLGAAGIMAATIEADGRVRIANRVLRMRATGSADGTIAGQDFARFLITDSRGLVRFEREGLEGTPLRVLQVPFGEGEDDASLVVLLDEEDDAPPSARAHRRMSAVSSA